MATLELEQAQVLADGRAVRLQFTVRPDPASNSLPDWMPAWANGDRLTLTSAGTGSVPLEPIGGLSQDHNREKPPVKETGAGGVPAGKYYLRVAFVDGSGNEVMLSGVGGRWNSDPFYPLDITATGGRKITIRFPEPLPAGHTVNIYGSVNTDRANLYGDPLAMGLLRRNLALPAGTEVYDLTNYVFEDVNEAPPGIRSWVTHWLVTGPNAVAKGEAVRLDGPAGLWSDRFGNVSGALDGASVTNWSRVQADGFTAEYTPDTVIYVSDSRGDNANPGTDPKFPKKGLIVSHQALPVKSFSAIRLLRGDTFTLPNSIPMRAGVDGAYDRPFIFEDYWHPDFGPDPGTRPVLVSGNFEALNGADLPPAQNLLFRRLEFRGTLFNKGDISWGGRIDHATFSDCVFNGVGVQVQIDRSTSSRFLTLHRCIIKDVQAEALNKHASGMYLDGVENPLVSQCLIDHNGWTPTEQRWNQNQNMYVQHRSTEMILWGCLITRGSGAGVQIRGGGTAAYNLFWRNSTGLTGYRCLNVHRNAFLESDDIGWAIDLNYSDGLLDAGCVAEFNIVANTLRGSGQAIRVVAGGDGTGQRLAHRIRHNLAWKALSCLKGGASRLTEPFEVYRNVFVQNTDGTFRAFQMNIGALASWSAWQSDQNVWFSLGSNPFLPQQGGSGAATTFAGYRNVTGQDANSILLTAAPTLVNSAWGVADFSAGRGGPANESDYLALVRERPAGVWGALYDGAMVCTDSLAPYAPVGLPAIDGSPFGHYGPRDYRATSYTILGVGPLTAGQGSSFSVQPSGVSSDTLTLSDQGAGGQFLPATLTWSNDALPRSFQYIPAGPGQVTLELRAAGDVVAWASVRFGLRGGLDRFRRRALRGGISSGLD